MKLKEFREKLGLKQTDLAKIVNRTNACVCDWERGKREPSIDDLIKLADFFCCSIDDIVGRVQTRNELDKLRELRPSTLKLVQASEPLNDMGIAVVIGYIARLIEENPEFLQIRR